MPLVWIYNQSLWRYSVNKHFVCGRSDRTKVYALGSSSFSLFHSFFTFNTLPPEYTHSMYKFYWFNSWHIRLDRARSLISFDKCLFFFVCYKNKCVFSYFFNFRGRNLSIQIKNQRILFYLKFIFWFSFLVGIKDSRVIYFKTSTGCILFVCIPPDS